MKKKIKTSISINPNYLEVADQLARREDRSRSYILDKILEVGLTATEKAENLSQGMNLFRKNIDQKNQDLKRRIRHHKINRPDAPTP